MSCPGWFPSDLLRNPATRVATEVMRAAAVFGPLTILLGPVVASLDAGYYLAEQGCDTPQALCSWARRTHSDINFANSKKEMITDYLGLAGITIPTEVWWVLDRIAAAIDFSGCLDTNDDGADMEPDAFAPMLEWHATAAPPGGTSTNSTANAYSHAYQEAAEVTYADEPNADLRPWLAAQLPVDIAFLQRRQQQYQTLLNAGNVRYLAFTPRIAEALRRLFAWNASVNDNVDGPWTRADVRRVLRGSVFQEINPVDVVDGSNGNEQESSGGNGGLIAAGVLGLLGLIAATR